MFVGIDVSKAKLDQRDIAALLKRLKKLSVSRIALEASGGYEIAAASELAAGLAVAVAIRARYETLLAPMADWRRPARSMLRSWRISPN